MVTLALYIAATVATAFAFAPWYFFALPLPDRHGHRRRVRRDQLGHRRADPGPQPRPGRPRDQRQLLGRRRRSAASPRCCCSTRRSSPRDLGWRLAFGARRDPRPRHPARAPPRPGEPALAVHPRPRGGGRADRRADRGGGARTRPARSCRAPRRCDHRPPARRDPVPRDRAHVVSSATRGARVLGLALFIGQAFLYNAVTFDLGTILNDFFDVGSSDVPYFIVALRRRQLPRPAAARAPVRHRRAHPDDRRAPTSARRRWSPCSALLLRAGPLDDLVVHGARRRRRSSSPRPARARPT